MNLDWDISPGVPHRWTARARGDQADRLGDPLEAVGPCLAENDVLGSRSIRYVARTEALRMLLVGEGVAFAFFYLVVPVTVVYASDSLHAGSGGYAAILAAWGAGIAIGSAAHVRLGRRIGPGLIFVSTSAVALGYLGTAAAPTLAVACAASVIGGSATGRNGPPWRRPSTSSSRTGSEPGWRPSSRRSPRPPPA